MQVRLATPGTSEDYVTGRLWRLARLPHCPWHPRGGCRLARHGTYERADPPGALIARWYCPLERRTVSALPDALASHQRGTLADVGATIRAIERAGSVACAARTIRQDIELPGALRYLGRLSRRVRAALVAIKGLEPRLFVGLSPTLAAFAERLDVDVVAVPATLRARSARHLLGLPSPIGFAPRRIGSGHDGAPSPHRSGRDPPSVRTEALVLLPEPESSAR